MKEDSMASNISTRSSIHLIPEEVIEGFLRKPIRMEDVRADMDALAPEFPGEAFDEKKVRAWLEIPVGQTERPYRNDEIEAFRQDVVQAYYSLTSGFALRPADAEQRIVHLTFGSPGAGKTTFARSLGAPVIDVNEVQKEIWLYEDAMANYGEDSVLGAVTAYQYGRWGANYVGNTLLNLIPEKYDIAYGTTATSNAALNLYDSAKASGLTVVTHMIVAPEDVRLEGVRKRCWGEGGDLLPIPLSHVEEKNKLFGPMVSKHFEAAGKVGAEIRMYYRGAVNAAPVEAARTDGEFVRLFNGHAQQAMVEEIQRYHPAFNWGNDVLTTHRRAALSHGK
jgi:predicted ABC-type ATPase